MFGVNTNYYQQIDKPQGAFSLSMAALLKTMSPEDVKEFALALHPSEPVLNSRYYTTRREGIHWSASSFPLAAWAVRSGHWALAEALIDHPDFLKEEARFETRDIEEHKGKRLLDTVTCEIFGAAHLPLLKKLVSRVAAENVKNSTQTQSYPVFHQIALMRGWNELGGPFAWLRCACKTVPRQTVEEFFVWAVDHSAQQWIEREAHMYNKSVKVDARKKKPLKKMAVQLWFENACESGAELAAKIAIKYGATPSASLMTELAANGCLPLAEELCQWSQLASEKDLEASAVVEEAHRSNTVGTVLYRAVKDWEYSIKSILSGQQENASPQDGREVTWANFSDGRKEIFDLGLKLLAGKLLWKGQSDSPSEREQLGSILTIFSLFQESPEVAMHKVLGHFQQLPATNSELIALARLSNTSMMPEDPAESLFMKRLECYPESGNWRTLLHEMKELWREKEKCAERSQNKLQPLWEKEAKSLWQALFIVCDFLEEKKRATASEINETFLGDEKVIRDREVYLLEKVAHPGKAESKKTLKV